MVEDLKQSLSKASWTGLTGGGAKRGDVQRREYLLDLDHPRNALLAEKIQNALTPYIRYVQKQYPSLQAVKVGAIRTLPRTMSQFEGLNGRLHSDYDNALALEYSPELRPMSLLVALDGFKFLYLPSQDLPRSQILEQFVASRQMVCFTHECLHAGGENDTDEIVYRLFAYACAKKEDIPNNRVFPRSWVSGQPGEDPRLVSLETPQPAEEEESCRQTTITKSGRRSTVPRV
jgi:hypothetical protein